MKLTFEENLADCIFMVEANGFEELSLWREYSKESGEAKYPLEWEDSRNGYSLQIGELDNRPVNLSFHFIRINNQIVCFYYPMSQLVDYKMIEKWLDENYSKKFRSSTFIYKSDAMNFHHCIHAIERVNKDL